MDDLIDKQEREDEVRYDHLQQNQEFGFTPNPTAPSIPSSEEGTKLSPSITIGSVIPAAEVGLRRSKWTVFKSAVITIILGIIIEALEYALLYQLVIGNFVFGSEVLGFLPLAVYLPTITLVLSVMILNLLLLRKKGVRRAWFIILLSIAATILVYVTVNDLLGLAFLLFGIIGSVAITLALQAVLYVGFMVLFDRIVNSVGLSLKKKWMIITAIILVLVVTCVAATYKFTTETKSLLNPQANNLEERLEKSTLQIYVPPTSADYPQPYMIAANGPGTPPGNTDFNLEAHMSLGEGEEVYANLYEYPYASTVDPKTDCSNLPEGALFGGGEEATCSLMTVLPSGTKLYQSDSTIGEYFAVKSKTLILLENPEPPTKEKIYNLFDHLQPMNIPEFLNTLHKQNPSEY